jgi:Tfp pilus tip-associated adhesin PilY1
LHSAAKFVEDIVNGDNSLDADTGKKFSPSTLQESFEALMSMDIQSVENLVELAATSNSSAILSELNKNYNNNLRNNFSSANLSTRMESFIKSLSNANLHKCGLSSQQALESLLHASSSSIFDAGKTYTTKV